MEFFSVAVDELFALIVLMLSANFESAFGSLFASNWDDSSFDEAVLKPEKIYDYCINLFVMHAKVFPI